MPSSKDLTALEPLAGSLNKYRVAKTTTTARGKRKRARFDAEKRADVKAVRHRGACLRCSVLKTKVSREVLIELLKMLLTFSIVLRP